MSAKTFHNGRVTLHAGDCLEIMRGMADSSVDSVCCDPPYHLTSIVKRFGGKNAAAAKDYTGERENATGAYARASRGFMGKTWDGVDMPELRPDFAYWLAGFADGEGCFVTRKSGKGFVCEFIIHIRADDVAILNEAQRQTGIGVVRDAQRTDGSNPMVKWVVSKQADCAKLVQIFEAFPLRAKKARDFQIWASAVREWISHEPGTSWASLAEHADILSAVKIYGPSVNPMQLFHYRWAKEVYRILKPGGHLVAFGGTRTFHRLASGIEDAGFEIRDQLAWCYGSGFPKSHNLKGDWEGWGTAIKPAWEPIAFARRPLGEKTVAANVLRQGVGAINIDGCRIEGDVNLSDSYEYCGNNGVAMGAASMRLRKSGTGANHNLGRWPANIIHDGSPEVLALFPETGVSTGRDSRGRQHQAFTDDARKSKRDDVHEGFADSGSAARFFYTAKASAEDRINSKHPTVKPISLIRWLVRLVTPPKGVVLDCFAGTGTLGAAAFYEGFDAILIEREEEYRADIERRMALLLAGPDEKKRALTTPENHDALPLFGAAQ